MTVILHEDLTCKYFTIRFFGQSTKSAPSCSLRKKIVYIHDQLYGGITVNNNNKAVKFLEQ